MMWPAFHPDGGAALIVAHGLAVAGMVAAVGGLALLAGIVHPLSARAARVAPGLDPDAGPRRFGTAGLWLALVATLAWYWLQTADFLGESDAAAVLSGLWPVLRDTDFGHTWIVQTGAIVVALLAMRRGRAWWAAGLASLALAAESGHAHLPAMAASDAGYLFALFVGAAHLLGGGFWVGGLWPLRQLLRQAPKSLALGYARGFSIWGRIAVLAVAFSGLWQAWVLVGDLPRLIGTAYGWMVSAKILLFLVLLGFALFNRYTLAPRMAHGDEAAARRALSRAILMQSIAGVAVLAAAMVLSALPPAMHERPIDPFAANAGRCAHASQAGACRLPAAHWPGGAPSATVSVRPASLPTRVSGAVHAHSPS